MACQANDIDFHTLRALHGGQARNLSMFPNSSDAMKNYSTKH